MKNLGQSHQLFLDHSWDAVLRFIKLVPYANSSGPLGALVGSGIAVTNISFIVGEIEAWRVTAFLWVKQLMRGDLEFSSRAA